MSAAARGAKQAGGLTVGILPGNDPREANPDIDVALATGMGEMRNALIVRAASAVIAIGGGWGTLSEIAMARRIETPVVGLHDSFTAGADIPRVEQPDEAVRWALDHARHREVLFGTYERGNQVRHRRRPDRRRGRLPHGVRRAADGPVLP